MNTRALSPRLTYLLKLLAGVAAFSCLFLFTDIAALRAALWKANYFLVVIGWIVFLSGQYCAAQRWRGVLRAGSVDVTRAEAWRLNQIGTFFGNFIPGQGGGDLVKSAFLYKRFPDRRAFLLASVIYDRLLGLSAVLGLALAGACAVGFLNGDWSLATMAAWALAIAAAVFACLRYFHRMQSLWRFFGERLGRRISDFSGHLAELFRNRSLFLRSFALSANFQLFWALSVWVTLRAIEPSVSLTPVLLAVPIAILIATMPVSLGGLGVREGALSLLLQRFGISADVAIAGALLSLVPILISSSIGACLAVSARTR